LYVKAILATGNLNYGTQLWEHNTHYNLKAPNNLNDLKVTIGSPWVTQGHK